jgi:hypothetical protein
MLLGDGPDVEDIGEIHLMGERHELGHCLCGRSFEECKVWRPVIQPLLERRNEYKKYTGKLITFLLAARFFLGYQSKEIKQAGEKEVGFLDAIGESANVKFIVDSSKHIGRLMLLLAARKVHVIHIVRHPLGHMYSRRKKVLAYSHADQLTNRVSRYVALARWTATNFLVMLIGTRIGSSRFQLVRYESFADAPAETVSNIRQKIGMQDSKAFVAKERHLYGANRVRFEKELIIKKDEGWKDHIGFKDRFAAVVTGAYALNRFLNSDSSASLQSKGASK